MDTQKLIAALKDLAHKSKAANDVFHVFATRERTRNQVTVESLQARMTEEGFKHSNEEYGNVLKALADLGFGKIKTGRKGRIVALVEIKTTLQSIGEAAVGRRQILMNYAPRSRYSPLALPPEEAPVEAPKPEAAKEETLNSLMGAATSANLIRTILEDQSVPADRKTSAVLALLGPSKET